MGACQSYQIVQSGDNCSSLAARCQISAADFYKYNPDPNLCSTLQPKQVVCCSEGNPPDLSPKNNEDGSCYTYKVKAGDGCWAIANDNYLTTDKIEQYNSQTWGWTGCGGLQENATICLSNGTPPMPSVVDGAVCGPQVRGTQKPSNWSDIASLNPCPLNACCSKWGNCGVSGEFCQVTQSPTGAPGTSGCISNCGTSITNNGSPPPKYLSVGYFEGYNMERPCLNMRADQIPSGYSHIHFGFGNIKSDFSIDVSSVQEQFDLFLQQTAFKKVLSFGGWSFSTNLDSYAIFSNGVKPANRATLALNIAAAVEQYGLDGVDFDWEYVGVELPGIPGGSPDDGANYLEFVKLVRSILPAGKTVSIAAPASYWYLQHFPIAEMSKVLDYIVYMTYDLHGQWDFASNSSQDGCPAGNCLRSHVNLTETVTALSVITKAGVPSNKVVVGIASYGRSFGMVDPSCTGPMCRYKGPASYATPGECTQTAGYLAEAEILKKIKENAPGTKVWTDGDSNSGMATFPDGTWVSYLNSDTKAFRKYAYQSLNFAGWVEWAVDLAVFVDDTSSSSLTSSSNTTAQAKQLPASANVSSSQTSASETVSSVTVLPTAANQQTTLQTFVQSTTLTSAEASVASASSNTLSTSTTSL